MEKKFKQSLTAGLLLTHGQPAFNPAPFLHVLCPCSAQRLSCQGALTGVRAADVSAEDVGLHAHAHAQQYAEQVNCKPQPSRAWHGRHSNGPMHSLDMPPPHVPYCIINPSCSMPDLHVSC